MGVIPRPLGGGFLPAYLGLAIAGLVTVADQASKYWIVHVFDLGAREPVRLLPVLDLVLAYNRGISYSLFRADDLFGRLMLIAVAFAALATIAVWIARTRSVLTAIGLGLIAGGAVGNVADRMALGAVVDFLHFHTPIFLGPLSNYVFNVADAAIFVGVMVLLYESFTAGRASDERAPAR